MNRDTKIWIGLITTTVAVGASMYIFRKQIKKIIAKDLGIISEWANKAVWSVRTENKLRELHPKMEKRARAFINKVKADKGINLIIDSTGGRRTKDQQAALYAQGRESLSAVNRLRAKAGLYLIKADANKKTVTKAKFGQSFHNYGFAIDVYVERANGSIDWKYDQGQLESIAKEFGLYWGGNFGDKPHFEYHIGGKGWRDLKKLADAGKIDSKGNLIV